MGLTALHYPAHYPSCQVPGFPGGAWPPPTGHHTTLAALTSAAGWPDVEWTSDPPPTQTSARHDHELGLLTHSIIGALAEAAQTADPDTVQGLIADRVGMALSSGRRGRQDRLRARLSGLTAQYFRLFLPARPTALIGHETVTPERKGRMDLVWDDPHAGVFVDEIKTWRHPHPHLDDDTWAQIDRYIEWGRTTHGNRFAGIRVISLGQSDQCKAVGPAGEMLHLHDSHLSRPALLRAHHATTAA